MKKYLYRMAVCALMSHTVFTLPSCDIKDDELWERVDELFNRVEKLEDACTQMNSDIRSIQSVLNAVQNNYSITSVTPLDNPKGYTIKFSNDSEITIHHGKDGENGSDGKDGDAPTISIKDMGNGQYAWLVNGELLCDAEGNPIPVNGKDGQDGKDGEDGKDGYNGSSAPTPIVKTGSELISSGINGSWDREAVYISVNSGYNWTKISSGNGDTIFSSVDTSKAGIITFTLTNGIKFSVPRTDGLASLIIGEWFLCEGGYSNAIYLFKADGIYTKTYSGSNDSETGTYEVIKERNSIILYDSSNNELLIDLIAVNEYLLKWINSGHSEVNYLYRSDAFIFEKNEIDVPKEGGTFTIQVDSKFSFRVSNNNQNYIEPNTTNFYSSANSTLSFTPTATDNSIVIEVEPNVSNLNLVAEFYIEDTKRNKIASIKINQSKNEEATSNEVTLSDWGKNELYQLLESVEGVYHELNNTAWDYITGENSEFKPVLSPNNRTLFYIWENVYYTINRFNKTLNQAELELPNGPLKAPLETLRAILYYNLAVHWGNIIYGADLNNFNSIQQLTMTELFENLVPQLENAIDVLEERKLPSSFESRIYLSKDVPRMVLAQIYMYQGECQKAELLYQKILDNNLMKDFRLVHRYIYTNTHILLDLAECKLNGNTPADADILIDEVLTNNMSLNIGSTEKKQIINEIYREVELRDGYFAFLKRNGLAKETIGITEDYLLLFPIPQSELDLNPNMVQNPGY